MSAFHYLARPRKINVCVHVYYRKKQGRGSSINNVRTWGGSYPFQVRITFGGWGEGSRCAKKGCE